jgi:hypothetical protein
MPRAVAFKTRRSSLTAWRAVEAQHLVSTSLLVDTLAEQEVLETLLEGSKPPVPAQLKDLHWLLFTPFRYAPPPGGSRFRGPHDPGVLYAADEIRTACAELGYWRWRHLLDSPTLAAMPQRPQTVFQIGLRGSTIDLREPPLARQRRKWIDPRDYSATQRLAVRARAQQIDLIRYESVRDPKHAGCVAVLDAAAFSHPSPVAHETWLLSISRDRVTWVRSNPLRVDRYEFVVATDWPWR